MPAGHDVQRVHAIGPAHIQRMCMHQQQQQLSGAGSLMCMRLHSKDHTLLDNPASNIIGAAAAALLAAACHAGPAKWRH